MADPFVFPVRVYYEDTDAGGIVYNANYLKFMERARTEFLRDRGIEQDGLLADGIAFVVTRTEIDFRSAARFNEQLTVTTQVVELKRASMRFEQRIFAQDGRLITDAQVQIACVTVPQMKPVAIPAQVKGVL
ncbi:acyl-CoA thioester hydrolase [Aeromonas sp. RU39B]|uniref:tol-pal system-associated acyl-CoA thioesterase n=1 Tax=Aeromonas sp. RU39B TaxID=1907416 RepID=UPI0009552D98|nr:tol-pal system-associated acyl-CoA thioesterase [Aeromonas sp. RU39B]SIQ35639.1 acyl-CoA thioester hydrolase [Aeromonas sp. RU39B]